MTHKICAFGQAAVILDHHNHILGYDSFLFPFSPEENRSDNTDHQAATSPETDGQQSLISAEREADVKVPRRPIKGLMFPSVCVCVCLRVCGLMWMPAFTVFNPINFHIFNCKHHLVDCSVAHAHTQKHTHTLTEILICCLFWH